MPPLSHTTLSKIVREALAELINQRGLPCTTKEACLRLKCCEKTLLRYARDPNNPAVLLIPGNGKHRYYIPPNAFRLSAPDADTPDTEGK